MGIVEKAPKKIVWRAIEYYKQDKEAKLQRWEDCYSAIVAVVERRNRMLFIDVKYPKECSCTCPFAEE